MVVGWGWGRWGAGMYWESLTLPLEGHEGGRVSGGVRWGMGKDGTSGRTDIDPGQGWRGGVERGGARHEAAGWPGLRINSVTAPLIKVSCWSLLVASNEAVFFLGVF